MFRDCCQIAAPRVGSMRHSVSAETPVSVSSEQSAVDPTRTKVWKRLPSVKNEACRPLLHSPTLTMSRSYQSCPRCRCHGLGFGGSAFPTVYHCWQEWWIRLRSRADPRHLQPAPDRSQLHRADQHNPATAQLDHPCRHHGNRRRRRAHRDRPRRLDREEVLQGGDHQAVAAPCCSFTLALSICQRVEGWLLAS